MAASDATVVEAGDREVRVSSPDRVIFPSTERTPAITKLDVVQVLPLGRRRHHARARAAADDAGALAEGRAPGHRPVDAREGRRRRLLSEADPARGAGVRADRADRVPLGPPRGRDLPDGARRRRLGRADGHDHLPPVAGPQRRRRPSRRAAPRPRPAARHGLRRRRSASPPRRACCSATWATSGSPRPPAAAGSTSTSGSSRAGRSRTSATPPSPSAASSSGACPAR